MAADNDDFDLGAFIQSPMQMLGTVMGAADTGRRTLTTLVDTVQSLQRSASSLEALLGRVNSLVDTVEAPARALAPEMDKFARRLREVSDALDGPIDSIVPGMQRMASAFDRMSFDQLPDALEMLSAQIMGLVGGLGELPKRLGPLGELFGGASGLFGLGLGRMQSAPAPAAAPIPVVSTTSQPTKAPAKKAPAKKAPAKQATAKKATTKQATAKQATAKKATANKAAAKKAAPRR